MLSMKEIDKIRKMYYEQHYSVTEINRIMKVSRETIYKYLRFVDFSSFVKENKVMHYLSQ